MGRVILLLSLLLASCGPYVGPDYPDGYDACMQTAYEMSICTVGGYEWVPGYYSTYGYWHNGHYRHGRAWQYPRDHRTYHRYAPPPIRHRR
jgi:hypothetical protein